jgi:hypothetical protein
MIRVDIMDPTFNPAYCNAMRALPVHELERPRQYGERWRETYRCRIEPKLDKGATYMIFDRDEDYTWFMLRWG